MIIQSAGAVEYTDSISAEWYDSPKECPGNDTKQSYCKAPVMLELWEMQSTFSLGSLPVPLGPGVVVSERVLSLGQIELFHV